MYGKGSLCGLERKAGSLDTSGGNKEMAKGMILQVVSRNLQAILYLMSTFVYLASWSIISF